MPLSDDPLMIVVGGDALALSTAREICLLQGHRVVVLWHADPEFQRTVEEAGAAFVSGRPQSRDGLDRAGVQEAVTILALSVDDHLNLQIALRARDANPGIRIVLRQFNRTLAHKIEQNLNDCSVLSLAWHSAATYAAAALDPGCLRGLQFPEPDGPLTGLATRIAEDCGVAGAMVEEAERRLEARIVALDGNTEIGSSDPIGRQAKLVIYGEIAKLVESSPRRPQHRRAWVAHPLLAGLARRAGRRPRLDRLLVRLALAAIGVFLVGSWYFHLAFEGDWLKAAYFVLTTMTTTGYGDVTPKTDSAPQLIAAMLLMLSGIIVSGLFIAYGASLLTRAQWVAMQGLRPVRRRGHIVLCGAGSIGSGVIDLLLAFKKPLVVVEATPDSSLVERARDRGFDLLTGDASRDEALDLCNLGAAHSLIALTNIDTLNLEIALGARARNPELPIVLRIAEASFAASIVRHFEFETTFSAAALAAPAFAGLSRLPGARGRIAFDDREFAIGEAVLPEKAGEAVPRGAIPLAVARDNGLALVHGFDEVNAAERVLLLIPLAPFREGKETLAAVAERVLPAEAGS
ncbi:MAG: NAD-binding protein [Alphaproteobacteria bacterium]|nr:NAD-binding protein [Alphaproteobacteria bacterium]